MNHKHHKFFKVITAICIVAILTSCAFSEGLRRKRENSKANFSKEEITAYQNYVKTILSNGSKEFFGSFALDEDFLSFIVEDYGLDALKKVSKTTDYSSPSIWYDATGCTIKSLYYSYLKERNINKADGKKLFHQKSKNAETILEFTGDINFADDIWTMDYLKKKGGDFASCFSQDLLSEMRSADILSVNNEFCYSTRGEALKGKDYTFRSNPKNASLFKSIGVDFVNVANNHVYDFGAEALVDTLDTLDSYSIQYVGAGRNLDEAMKPLYYNINGRLIAFVSATQIERSYNYTKEATVDSPGVLKTLNSEKYVKVIRSARANADIVIAIVHWGTEGNPYYASDQVELANDFVNAGADAIIGCHSHCLQGVSYIGKVPVYYSLGNFWFSLDEEMPETYKTGIAKLKIGRDGKITPYFVPCEFNTGSMKKITDKTEYAASLEYLQSLSQGARLTEDGQIVAR